MTFSQQIVIVRHGGTLWTQTGQHTGTTDLDLSESGKKQALFLKKRLHGMSFTKVFISDLKRAKETCAIAGYSDKAEVLSDLAEWNYGEYEGLTTEEIHKTDPLWNVFLHGCPQGESVSDASHRADRVLAKLKACPGNVLIFSSGHISRLLAARWLGLPPQDGRLFFLSTASVSTLGYEHKTPVLLLWNDVSHLG